MERPSFVLSKKTKMNQKPSNAFIGASWAGLLTGSISYRTGLWNANLELSEKGYYFTILMYGLYSAVSLQKAVRDQLEGIRVTAIYYGIKRNCSAFKEKRRNVLGIEASVSGKTKK